MNFNWLTARLSLFLLAFGWALVGCANHKSMDFPIKGDLGDTSKVEVANKVISRLNSSGIKIQLKERFKNFSDEEISSLSMQAISVMKNHGSPLESAFVSVSINSPSADQVLPFIRERINEKLEPEIRAEVKRLAEQNLGHVVLSSWGHR